MSSTLEPQSASSGSGDPHGADQGRLVEYERYIASQIRKTRGQVKGVEIAGAVLRLLVGALVYLLVIALVDHWLLAEGLGMWGRLAALAGFIVGVGAYAAIIVTPLLTRRVNPVYAAHTIEQHQPTLKNSLVNFLLLRGSRRELAPAVYQAIEQRAANDLQHVPVETVVDRTRLVRWSYALLVVVAVFALYVLLSPKDPLRSLARMIAPWADLRPPTRVTIEEVKPGDMQAFHGDRFEVSALVRGVGADEPVTLFYTTDDGQTVDRPIAMTVPPGDYRHVAELPEGSQGLQQGITYYIAAGDFSTDKYRVEVLTAPAILVEAVDYAYPSYAAIANRRVERVGDITALVGTKVTVHGRANREIKSAHLDYDCDGTRDKTIFASGPTTSVAFEFELKLNAEGKAEYGSYQLLFVGTNDRENPQPIRHTIEVAPDRAPTVELVLPDQPDLEVPLNGVVSVAVRAEDPDFALREVALHVRRGTDVLLREPLHDASSPPHEGEFRGGYILDLSKLRPEKPGRPALAAGDVIDYWAEARDIKLPAAGHAESSHYRLRVTSPGDQQQREEQLADAKRDKEEFEKPAGDDGAGGSDEAEYQVASRDTQPSEDAEQGGDSSEESSSRVDPEKDAAAAMKEILKHEEQKKPSPTPGDKPNEADSQGDEGQPDEGDKGEGSSGEQNKQQPGGDEGKKQPGEQQQGKNREQDEGQQPGQSGGEEDSSESNGAGSESSSGGKSDSTSSQGEHSDNSSQGGDAASSNDSNGPASAGEDAGGKPGEAGEKAKPTGKPGEGQADERVRREEDGPGEGRQEQRSESGKAGDSKPGDKENGQPGEQGASGTDAPGEKAEPASGKPQAAESQEDSPQLDTEKSKPGERSGQGAQSGQSGDANKPQSPPSDADVNENAKGGEPEDPKGNSGAGQAQGNEQGSPSPQEKNTPKEKEQQSPDSKNKESGEPSSPSTSPKESDSQGGEQGDRSGGGQEGGGQKANQKGTGGAGQNTAADEGGGAAEGSGGGETSDKADDKQPGGEGSGESESGQGAGGEQSGQGGEGQESGGASAGGQPGEGGASSKPGAGPGSQGAGGQGGGGQNDSESAPSRSNSGGEPGGDEADLEAARKATDLVLDRLEDQLAKNELDQDLLDRLGWKREDVERFVKRWQDLKAKAGDDSTAEGAKRLEAALRQLGLSSAGTVLDGNENKPTEQRQIRESFRSNPPADYAEQYRAYTEGLSRGRASAQP